MATSWAQETDENVNYTKLCRLLYDGGTLAVKTVFDGKVPPSSLGVALATNKHALQRLKRPTGRVLSQDQWDLLYPPGAVPKSEDFDITLLFVLLRNICGLSRPATGWDALPAPTDTSPEANLVRIKYYRNKVTAHSSKAEVDDTQFEAYWKDISSALVVLGLKQNDIDELKSSPLGEKKYNQLVEFWYLSDEEIKQHLEAIESKVESNSAEIKSKLCSIESKLQNPQLESEVDKLAHIHYTSLVKNHCKKYHPSTRKWVLDQVEEYIKTTTTEACAVVIRAGPGMGKSIVAAKICEIYQNNGLLGGCHIFQHSNSLRNNPRIMLQSIARQLCNTVPGYQAALGTKLNALQGKHIVDLTCEELFGILFEEPLGEIHMDYNVVIVIDALDECASQYKEEIENVLESKLCNLPSWIRFVITTRPLPSCRNLNPAALIVINESDQRNVQDLRTYLEFELVQRNARDLTCKFVSISSGLFLVAYFLLNILDESGRESILNAECFPHGISSVYKHYFKRIQSLIKPYIETSQPQDSFYQMLQAVVASESPIPKEMFYKILHLKRVEEVDPEKIKERNDAVHLLHTIFPVENDHVTVFHKTVADWLSLKDDNRHQFSVCESKGFEVLAEKSWFVIKAFKEREKPLDQPLVVSDSEKFAFQFGTSCLIVSCKPSVSKLMEIIKDITVDAAVVSLYNLNNLLLSYFQFIKNEEQLFLYCLLEFEYSSCTTLKWREVNVCFGHWLSATSDLLLHFKKSLLSPAEKTDLRDWLVAKKLPHYSLQYVASDLPHFEVGNPFTAKLLLCQVTDGFIALLHNDGNCKGLYIKSDGSFGEQKTFEKSHSVRGVTPDKKYLITTSSNSSKLKCCDVETLQCTQEYNCPMDDLNSCCVYVCGDSKQWYIVIKDDDDPNIYILDGSSGQLYNKIELPEHIDILEIKPNGCILMQGERKKTVTFVPGGQLSNENKKLFLYKIHSRKPHSVNLNYSIHNRAPCFNRCKAVKLSDDGNYFALFYSSGTVYVFYTKDGTLYRKCDLPSTDPSSFNHSKIVFLSSSGLIIRYIHSSKYPFGFNDLNQFLFYDLVNIKLKYCASVFLPRYSQPLVVPPQGTDKFIPALYALTGKELVKIEFHCLEQSFLDST